MKYLNRLMVSALFLTSVLAQAETAVIVSLKNNNSYTSIDKELISRIFLAKVSTFPDGTIVKPIYLKQGNEVRETFNRDYLSKSESQLGRYWSKLRFSGKGEAPEEVGSAAELKALVANDPSLIGYIDSLDVDGTIKVVHQY